MARKRTPVRHASAARADIVERFETAQDRLILQAADLSLETLASMVESQSIDIEPVYQRRERWRADKQSALIESFLINVPVPPIYLAEDDFGVYSVIDGKQRLTSIRAFMRDELALINLQRLRELEGSRFSDLPAPLANALQVRPYLRVVTLLRQSDPELKYEVFTRLNTGGEPLNAQEIRNVVFRGPLNDLIYGLAEHPFLRQQLKITSERSPSFRNMTDAEFVLRFLTLLEHWRSFSGELARSMDDFMRANQAVSRDALDEFKQDFEVAIDNCAALWGVHAFQRPVGNGWRAQALAGMYDTQMIGVAQLKDVQLKRLLERRNKVVSGTRDLFGDSQFEAAVRVGTNTPSRVRYRIERMTDLLWNLADA
jgi:Protein of unknown function DUF262